MTTNLLEVYILALCVDEELNYFDLDSFRFVEVSESPLEFDPDDDEEEGDELPIEFS